jgi:hypothetical protein
LTEPRWRERIDWLSAAVRREFAADLEARPSRHVYVSSLPEGIRRGVAELRDLPQIRDAIRAQYLDDAEITSMDETDELYVCHYNEDQGGDHGLFAKHYDGNLRFLPYGAVVRALVYLASDGSYEVVFRDSGLTHGFRTYEIGLLDFHRELHWVRGRYVRGAPDRILLKLNYLVTPRGQPAMRDGLRALNLGQFRVVKAAMEYSKSPRTPAQRVVGLVCNVVRALNNVHPLLPHLAAASLLGVLVALAIWLGPWAG